MGTVSKRFRALDPKLARELYDDGKNDGEIARITGCSKTPATNWRRAHGLPSQTELKKPKPARSKLEQDAMDARAAGLTYGQYKARTYVPPFVRPVKPKKR